VGSLSRPTWNNHLGGRRDERGRSAGLFGAANAEPWEPLPGMVKRQCPRCRYFFAAPEDADELHCVDCVIALAVTPLRMAPHADRVKLCQRCR
jgi:hypothetical protein